MTVHFLPVSTLADLESLDQDEIVSGYREYRADDPEPGANRGRAYWHGWMNRARDCGKAPLTEASARLAREYLASERAKRKPKQGAEANA